jgi:CubicO group peptidase (beta-lactamase class C family)
MVIVCFLLVVYSSVVFGNVQLVKRSTRTVDDIDDFILNEMENRHIPGLSASVVIDETVVWQNAYGYADTEQNITVNNETLFKIASVSKTITATALMQLYEHGYFDLYDPINDYLPFDVVHPDYPSTYITFHMLLTHSSGINDNWDYLFHFVGDSPISFQTFLEEYLAPGGDYYNADNNFCSWEPGTSWRYSNIAVALVGYLVEAISNTPFTEYCQTYIFNALDMVESAWYLRDLNISHIAMPYHWNGYEYEPYGHIGYVDVPAGDLRTSSFQLLNFLSMFINNGIYNQQVVLSNNIVELMLTPQLSFNNNIGLIWWKSSVDGRIVWGHGGSDFGARAQMQFDPETQIGVVVLINGEASISRIVDMLFDYAETLVDNFPPDKPSKAQGTSNGKTDVEYFYSTVTLDPDNDQIYYMWDWDDGTFSEWLGPFDSGEACSASHMWNEQGAYGIRIKAKDTNDAESAWSDSLPISIPKTYDTPLFTLIGMLHNWLEQLIGKGISPGIFSL